MKRTLLIDGVQAGERFVEDNQMRIVRDGCQDLHFLAHAF